MSPEIEYFYFLDDSSPTPLEQEGHSALSANDSLGKRVRKCTAEALAFLGIGMEYVHHEVAPSQQKTDLAYGEALEVADSTVTFKLVVREIAAAFGVYASFMPKPVQEWNGNGMHVHQSLWQGDRNVFFDGRDDYSLSDVAKQYIAGLMHHAQGMAIVTNQWVNSYKRMVPGYEAPTYTSWGRQKRSALVRVPAYKPGRERETRVEYRCPDPACNPYLAFTAILAAGLDGVAKALSPGEPQEEDLYSMSASARQRRGIATLPQNLSEAITAAEQSPLLREALGDHVFEKLLQNKRLEWDMFRRQVTDYELQRHLAVL